MTSIRENIKRLLERAQPLPPGNYHYLAPASDPNNYRLHLRLEPDGNGVLIINASTVLHLNQTAAEYAFYLVHNMPEEQVASNISTRYRVKRDQALSDYRGFVDRIETLITMPDLDPVSYLDFERQAPFSGSLTAPYRLDCALTYLLPEGDTGLTGGATPVERVGRELDTVEWKTILEKAWGAGIPHIVFTGGEPTLRADLAQLLHYAETKGQVTGLLTDGLRLADPEYLDTLLQTGLDHLMMIWQTGPEGNSPAQEQAWKALENTLAADLFVAVHLTLTAENAAGTPALLERLAQAGVKAISLSEAGPDLQPALDAAREQAAGLQLELVWNLPVPYSRLNPVSLEAEQEEQEELPVGAGRAWLYVEPDGDVLPAQGINQLLGNLLSSTWEAIWEGEALGRFHQK